jgi:D-glycero-alpha-D-manno-heptose-7-phosphate kinase
MIITQAPVRISFLGGGTDYAEYFKSHGGETLTTSINKYTTVTVHTLTQFADHCARIHYSRVETVQDIEEIQHPSARECLKFLGIGGGIEIHYVSDLPARTGLGSSSSATVALLHALHAFKGELVSCEQLAEEAVHVEQNLIGERVGSQDQYSCALGGLQYLKFKPDGRVQATLLVADQEKLRALQERLMLFYTGIQRHAHELLEEQLQRTEAGDNTQGLHQMKALVRRGVEVLTQDEDLSELGLLLHESWIIKRRLSSRISTLWIDEMYDKARAAGAVGGKLLGAGGGGFLMLYVEPKNQQQVRSALPNLRETEFQFENIGSRVVFYRP